MNAKGSGSSNQPGKDSSGKFETRARKPTFPVRCCVVGVLSNKAREGSICLTWGSVWLTWGPRETQRRWNRIRGKGAVAMAEGLRANSCVEILDLGWNGIGDDGFVAFGELLATDTAHLVELVLRYVFVISLSLSMLMLMLLPRLVSSPPPLAQGGGMMR